MNAHGVLKVVGVVDSDLCDAAAIPVRQHLVGVVTATHPDSLGEDLLQLRSSSARYQRPYQRQGIIVEVRLHNDTTSIVTSITAIYKLFAYVLGLA